MVDLGAMGARPSMPPFRAGLVMPRFASMVTPCRCRGYAGDYGRPHNNGYNSGVFHMFWWVDATKLSTLARMPSRTVSKRSSSIRT